MIPELTMNVLTTGFGHVGTATIDKKSYHTDTMGVSVDQQNDTISCFVKSSIAEEFLKNVNKTKKISFYLGLETHEAYNFKGTLIETYDLGSEELSQSENFRKSFIDKMKSMGLPEDGIKKIFGNPPDKGLKFKVEKIFKQTPGPEAGQELSF